MKIIDLTHPITPTMPVYPGTEQPGLVPACTIEKDGFRETKLTMYSHTGTHMDSPAHLFKQGKTLDAFTPEYFYGPAIILDVSAKTGEIGVAELVSYQEVLARVNFLLLYTGWHNFWGGEKYFAGFPVLSPEAARWLTKFPLKAVGVDAISIDQVTPTGTLPIHQTLLANDILIVENLTNLNRLVGKKFIFCCLPLNIYQADGAPVRAIAIINE